MVITEKNEGLLFIMKVAQWIRVQLPMQGSQVQSLVWEDSTGLRAAKPAHHNS